LTVLPGRTACYRCLFPDEPPPAARRIRSQGPLGALAGLVGTIQAMEAIKGVLGIGILLTNRVLTCEVLSMAFRTVAIRRNAHCPLCA